MPYSLFLSFQLVGANLMHPRWTLLTCSFRPGLASTCQMNGQRLPNQYFASKTHGFFSRTQKYVLLHLVTGAIYIYLSMLLSKNWKRQWFIISAYTVKFLCEFQCLPSDDSRLELTSLETIISNVQSTDPLRHRLTRWVGSEIWLFKIVWPNVVGLSS